MIDRADRRRDESMVVPLLFTAVPAKAIASDDHEGTDALYEYDLSRLELGRKIFAAPGFEIDRNERDNAGTGLAGVRYTADGPGVHRFDAGLAKVHADIGKGWGGGRGAPARAGESCGGRE